MSATQKMTLKTIEVPGFFTFYNDSIFKNRNAGMRTLRRLVALGFASADGDGLHPRYFITQEGREALGA